jgi:thymidine phosphorylase
VYAKEMIEPVIRVMKAIGYRRALVFKVAGKTDTISAGMERAVEAIDSGKAWNTLQSWVAARNRQPEKGLDKLRRLID